MGQRSLQPQLRTLAAEAARATRPPLSANATPEIKEFIQNRETLTQRMAQLRQQNPSTNAALDPKVIAQFQHDNAALLQRQKEIEQIIGQQQAKNPLPASSQLQIPPNALPQMQDYLAAHDQLMRDMADFMKQHQGDAPAARRAAIQQWQQQNASRFQQLQQESHALAQASLLTPTSPATQYSNSTPAEK
jgi:hypothetical protein